MSLKLKWVFSLLLVCSTAVERPLMASEKETTSKASQNKTDDQEVELTLDDEPPPKRSTPKPTPAEKIEELQKRIVQKPKDMKARVRLAEAYEKRKDYDQMVNVLLPVSDQLPREGLLLLAKAYAGQKLFIKEIRALEILQGRNPKDYFVLYSLGDAYSRAGKSEDAIANFNSAKQANPKFFPPYEGLLKEYQKVGEKYEARSLLSDMIGVFGEKPQFLAELCRLYSVDSFIEKAVEVCQRAIARDPKAPDNHVYLGISLKEKEETSQAEKVLKKAAQQFPDSELAQHTAGQFSMDQKNVLAAFKFFEQGTKADPKSKRCWLGLAKAAFDLQKFPEGIEAYSKLCSLDSTSVVELRRAAAMLRQKNETVWSSRLDEAISRCGFQ